MFTSGLLLLIFNIFEVVSASGRSCDPSSGTYPNPGRVLDPLVEKILLNVKGNPEYDCEYEKAIDLKLTLDDDGEMMREDYPHVTGKELDFKVTKNGDTEKTLPETLVDEVLQNWSGQLPNLLIADDGALKIGYQGLTVVQH
ncbi:hypothetical protein Y032_0106g3732 [Ancylostoma ceylanicum]|uniref:Uncharacterized protein n=1 Tax=Ancylostoma ceylanicum TaxID=53326 RepID=A0A016TFR8_9BILA|nr:hypothetical protein Y032_0106g3732 [Ancylostoma ceylanicum]